MSIKLVIFDLDGTLLNTIDDLAHSVNYVLQKHGYATHSVEQYKLFVGNGITKLIARAIPKELASAKLIAKLQADFVAYYAKHSRDKTALYGGIEELLGELKASGITLAVASNKHHTATVELINHYFGSDTFSVVYGKREGVYPKPDPTIIYDIIKQCDVSASEVVYVGDSSVDMETANNASICSVGVTWGFRSQEELEAHGAQYIIDSPKELLSLVFC